MTGSITRALNWDYGYEQQFIAVTPIGDEVILYQTNHEDPGVESNSLIKLNNKSGFDNIQCSSYSYINKGIIGVGSHNSTVSIFDINLTSSSVLQLRPKQDRPCNSISFSDNNLIVAGYDKGRQDNSLQIWNIEDQGENKRPLTSYLPNEAILSTIFYPDQSNIICGSYKFLREFDLRSDQPVFQMATKCTLGLNIDHFQNHLFQSFSEDGSLAIWDRRKLTSNNVKKSIASGIVQETPILQFSKLLNDFSSRKVQHPCVRYSSIRKGEFAAIFNGDLIRRWHTGNVPPARSLNQKTLTFKSKHEATLQSLKQQSSLLYKPNEESLFVSMVLDVQTDYKKVISFDYSPDTASPTSTNFVCMRQSGTVFRMPVVECIENIDFNPINEFSITGPEGSMTNFLEKPVENLTNENLKERNRSSLAKLGDLENNEIESETEMSEDDESAMTSEMKNVNGGFSDKHLYEGYEDIPLNTLLNPIDIIENDLCNTIRKRAEMGYAFDCENNSKILEQLDLNDNQLFLRNTWKWLGLAKKSLEKGTMISEGIDLGYQGVLGIWKGIEELQNNQNRTKDSRNVTDVWFSQAVKSIISQKGKKTSGIQIPSDSEKKAQRKLCLIVSGWYLTSTELEQKLQTLVSMGLSEKAAGWSVFHGDVSKAIEILSTSKKERLRLMATAVAGYLAYKNSNINSPWKDQCRKMASELDDPYLRAIFAFIADDDWWDVLDEHSLPLRERLGVALRFLSDKDLTVYLYKIADTVVNKGELEGLILTGITPKGIELLQNYVNRTSDVQTASLIASYACPRYFNDQRSTHWIDCYRNLLNSWGYFSIRAKFDVARSKLSKTFTGETVIKPRPKQVYLQCQRCNRNLSKFKNQSTINSNIKAATSPPTTNSQQILMKQFNKLNKNNTTQNQITNSCPYCRAPLPRCSICLLSMGTEITSNESNNKMENTFKEWFSYCLTCNHCYHAIHAQEWFSKHFKCPVPDCNCKCNSK
ncbi:unnamed protein product [Candida verbasci]|uniref:WD repeat protein mio zinc-ribbon like domain-containing protein n=1 Tax=Candida verbasci TaxID=1227364 RepID=A0A9W4TWV7_9ASCO|nr:unnamed protein product [Candida verbasci]